MVEGSSHAISHLLCFLITISHCLTLTLMPSPRSIFGKTGPRCPPNDTNLFRFNRAVEEWLSNFVLQRNILPSCTRDLHSASQNMTPLRRKATPFGGSFVFCVARLRRLLITEMLGGGFPLYSLHWFLAFWFCCLSSLRAFSENDVLRGCP